MKTLFSLLATAAILATAHAQKPPGFETIYRADSLTNAVSSTGPLLQVSDGSFYGADLFGGANPINGSLYHYTLGIGLTLLHSFSGSADGSYPSQPPVLGDDGNFYGVAQGGPGQYGIIYKITPDGTYTKMHAFDPPNRNTGVNFDGYHPVGALVKGGDGNFYGANIDGGASGRGTVYRITPSRVFTTLHSFTGSSGQSTPVEGRNPISGLAFGPDGTLYGTTSYGGTNGTGTVYGITPTGAFATVCSFPVNVSPGTDTSNGYSTTAAKLTLTSDGTIYGVGQGYNSTPTAAGVLYKVAMDGTLTILHTFDPAASNGQNMDGANPTGPLVLANDGNFYGSARNGGPTNYGTIFRCSPAGDFSVVCNFTSDTDGGSNPPILGSDGRLYGTLNANVKGINPYGTIYALAIAPFVTSPATATAEVGRAFSYQITATNDPTDYRVASLPPGVSTNHATGLVSGKPTKAGTFNATIETTNANGTGTAPLTVTVQPAGSPFITSPATASGTRGQPFTYQITADYDPARFAVVGLPGGLHVDAATGLISGTPTGFATYTLTLKAINAKGVGTQTLTLTIARS